MEHKFPLGQVVMTRGLMNTLLEEYPGESAETILAPFIRRRQSGDWGELDPEDVEANNRALKAGTRLLSAYTTSTGVKFWIITEWDRSYTTALLPSDY